MTTHHRDNEPPEERPKQDAGREWRSQAACRGADPELFFPTAEAEPARTAQVAAAKAVCARCPVRAECLTEALARIPYGIAGGLTEYERRRLRAGHQQVRGDGGLSPEALEVLADGLSRGISERQRAGIGRALLANGRPVRQVARVCGVTERTAARWAATTRTAGDNCTTGMGEGSAAATGSPPDLHSTTTPRQGHEHRKDKSVDEQHQ